MATVVVAREAAVMVAAMVAEAKVVEVMAEETRVVGVKEVVGKAATTTLLPRARNVRSYIPLTLVQCLLAGRWAA